MNDSKGLLGGLLPDNINVSVDVTLENNSIIKLGICLVSVLVISLLVYGIIKKSI